MCKRTVFIAILTLFMAACSQEACENLGPLFTYHPFRLLDSGLIEFKVTTKNVTNVEAFLTVDSEEESMIQQDEETWIATAPPPDEGKMMVQFRIVHDGWLRSRVEDRSLKYLVWLDEKSEVRWEILDEK